MEKTKKVCIGCGAKNPTRCQETLCDTCWVAETRDDELSVNEE